jgi:leucyl-tRNA synthetase
MSKSKNNGVDPQSMIDQYGADTCRLFMMFASPPDMSLEWSDSGVEGSHRFLKRVWRLAQAHVAQGSAGKLDIAALDDGQKAIRRAIHLAIRQASQDVGQNHKFNTAIAQVMTLMNVLEKAPQASAQDRALLQEGLETVALLLAPITPHISHELWQQLGHSQPVIDAGWPVLDASALVQDSITLVIQVNGKLRGQIDMPASASREEIEAVARSNDNVLRFIDGQLIGSNARSRSGRHMQSRPTRFQGSNNNDQTQFAGNGSRGSAECLWFPAAWHRYKPHGHHRYQRRRP